MSAPAPCAGCGQRMGDGDRALHGRCTICLTPRTLRITLEKRTGR